MWQKDLRGSKDAIFKASRFTRRLPPFGFLCARAARRCRRGNWGARVLRACPRMRLWLLRLLSLRLRTLWLLRTGVVRGWRLHRRRSVVPRLLRTSWLWILPAWVRVWARMGSWLCLWLGGWQLSRSLWSARRRWLPWGGGFLCRLARGL